MRLSKSTLTQIVVSLALLLILSAATTPLNNVVYVIIFLLLFFYFTSGVIKGLVELQRGRVSGRARNKILVSSLSISAIIALRSLQSLGWPELILLGMLWALLLFYMTRARSDL